MITPVFATWLFVFVLLGAVAGVAAGFMTGSTTTVVSSIAGLVVARIAIESVMVLFRIADESEAARECLEDIRDALQSRDSQPR